jgi:serine protease DegQ
MSMFTDSSALAALSSELANAVERLAPSIVYVDSDPRRDASGIALSEHAVVTTEHTIDREDEIVIRLGGEATARATLVGRDPTTDLALLHTDASLVPVPRAALDALKVGHIVLALARDEDGEAAASMGVLSSLDGPWRTWRGGDVDRFIRPDLNLYSGFSGGALADAHGAVIGVNTWGLSRRTPLTVPLSTVVRVAEQLEAGGRIKRGYLGVAMQAVRLPQRLRSELGIEQESAVIVVDVAPEGPAERAGALIGDVLLALGGRALEDSDDVARALGSETVGTTQRLDVLRAGRRQTLEVLVGERSRNGE